jgi:integrase
LNTLINERQDHLPILELLPDAPFALPETNARQPFGGIELPESFWEDLAVFEAFVCARRKIDEPADDDELDEDEGIPRQQRIAPYRDALSWLIRELIADEAIDPMAIHEVADVVDSQLVLRAAKRFRHRRDAGETKSEASTLHHYVRRLYAIARVWLEVPDDEQQRFRNLLKKKSVQTRNVGNIAADREIWLRHVILDKKSVIRDTLLHAPETFMNEADRRLRCWSELSVTERVRTLHFAMVAAQMALLVRAMAVRRRNLRELRFRGPQPTFIPPTGTSEAWIDIPPEEVKNERHLRAPVPEPAWRMIKRWLEVYRPLLVHHHPTGHTASDNDFVFPGRDGPISESQFERAFHFAVGTLGLGMSPHMIRHAVAGIILHENPNMLEAVADFLGNDPKTVRKYYSFLDTARGVSESQNVLADQAQKARKRQNTARRRQRRGT